MLGSDRAKIPSLVNTYRLEELGLKICRERLEGPQEVREPILLGVKESDVLHRLSAVVSGLREIN